MAVLSTLPASYGPIITNRDYEFLLQDDDFHKPVIALDGHSLGAPDVDSSDPVSVPRMFRERGRLIQRMVYVKPSIIRTRSYEIGFPTGAFWTPLLKLTQSVGGCRRAAFARYLCPSKPCFEHFFEYPDALFDPVVEQEAIIATDDDETGIAATATMHTTKRLQYNHLRVSEAFDNSAGATPDNTRGIRYAMEECENCAESDRHAIGYVFGDDGEVTPAAMIKLSEDGFATFTDLSANVAATSAGSDDVVDAYADGDFAIFLANDATDSEILVTTDRGATFTLATNASTGNPVFLAQILNAVAKGLGYYWAVGTAGKIWRSQDGLTWSAFTLPAAMAAYIFNDVAVDTAESVIYFVGSAAGNLLVVRSDGEGVVDLSTTVAGGAAPAIVLNAVHVLAPDHIIVGGASGTLYESVNAVNSPDWTELMSGTTSAILEIGGVSYRTLFITATNVYERSMITDMQFAAVEKISGVAFDDNLTGLDTGETFYGANNFAMSSLTETFNLKDCLPDS